MLLSDAGHTQDLQKFIAYASKLNENRVSKFHTKATRNGSEKNEKKWETQKNERKNFSLICWAFAFPCFDWFKDLNKLTRLSKDGKFSPWQSALKVVGVAGNYWSDNA